MFMLPIEFANGWLFTIKKVRPELQAKLNLFRAEAFLALDAWFRQGLRKDDEKMTVNLTGIFRSTTTSMPVTTELVTLENNKPMTTSLKVAEVFGKLHKNVIRDIENLDCSVAFRRLNFERTEIEVQAGPVKRKSPVYLMTRDGFTFLAMGFNGKRAAQFKEKYIEAFNRMEAELMKRQANALPDFTNPVEAARAWADQVEQKMALEAQTKALAYVD